jgi:hypothetical protein
LNALPQSAIWPKAAWRSQRRSRHWLDFACGTLPSLENTAGDDFIVVMTQANHVEARA